MKECVISHVKKRFNRFNSRKHALKITSLLIFFCMYMYMYLELSIKYTSCINWIHFYIENYIKKVFFLKALGFLPTYL